MKNIRVKNIIEAMEEYAPRELALEWDNVGLMIGCGDMEVEKVLLCLDVTTEVIDEAVNLKCNMIISHHPYIFHSMKNIDLNTRKGKDIEKIIKNRIAVYSAHTNLDFAEYGVNYYLNKIVSGIISEKNMTVDKFAEELKRRLASPYVKTIYGKGTSGGDIVTDVDFMSSCGSCGKFVTDISNACPRIFVTGEIGYNDALELSLNGVTVIEAGHYDTEVIILPYLREYLERIFGNIFHLTKTDFKVSIT